MIIIIYFMSTPPPPHCIDGSLKELLSVLNSTTDLYQSREKERSEKLERNLTEQVSGCGYGWGMFERGVVLSRIDF